MVNEKYVLKNGIIYKDGFKLSGEGVCSELNYLEGKRIEKNKLIEELRNENNLLFDVCDGFESFLKLKNMGVL